jgi:hypothetical protein
MTPCEKEFEIASALRAGALSAELIDHIRICPSCAETERVAGALLRSASSIAAPPPHVALVWRNAELRRQEAALRRATRPLIFMRALSIACTLAFAVWILLSLPRILPQYRTVLPTFTVATQASMLGAGFAVVLVALGAWFLLRDSRHPLAG